MEQGSNRNARVAELIRLACVMFLIVIAIGVFVFQDATVLYGALVSVASLAVMSNIIRRWRGRGPYAASVVRTSDHGRRDDVWGRVPSRAVSAESRSCRSHRAVRQQLGRHRLS